jgi:UDP-N-acetylmuramate dehydrogenase
LTEQRFLDDYASFPCEKPFPFSRHSFIGCGGRARCAFYPQTEQQLVQLVSRLRSDGIRYYTVGNLTNVLPPDNDVDTVLISTKRLRSAQAAATGLYVGAGVNSGMFLRLCKTYGLGGAEFFAGIPCTMGGALFMNAGAAGEYIAPFVGGVKVFDGKKTYMLSATECKYAYKQSIFMQEDLFILGGTLRLPKMQEEEIARRTDYFLQKRAHLPKGKSMGCVFKNPPNGAAGKYIEGAGLKGLRIGGAKISEKHANFIINDLGATSADIHALITLMKNAVLAQYNIRLEEEIRYIQ